MIERLCGDGAPNGDGAQPRSSVLHVELHVPLLRVTLLRVVGGHRAAAAVLGGHPGLLLVAGLLAHREPKSHFHDVILF